MPLFSNMSIFCWSCLVLYYFSQLGVSDGQTTLLDCSSTFACRGEYISCFCLDDQTRELTWRVFMVNNLRSPIFSAQYTVVSNTGSTDTNGDYTTILNGTNPALSSQLTVRLTRPITVRCEGITTAPITLQIVTEPPRPPINLNGTFSPNPNTGNVIATLWWDPPMEDSAAATITGYQINITELVTGLTQQLSSTNTSVTTQLNTAGEYLVQVVAVNCAGAGQGSDTIHFFIDCAQRSNATTTIDTTSSVSTLSTTKTTIRPHSTTTTPIEVSTSTPPLSSSQVCVERWQIGIAAASIVIIQIVCTAVCVTTAVVLKNKQGHPPTLVEMSSYADCVQSEGPGQKDPYYEVISPRTNDEAATLKLKENVAYN